MITKTCQVSTIKGSLRFCLKLDIKCEIRSDSLIIDSYLVQVLSDPTIVLLKKKRFWNNQKCSALKVTFGRKVFDWDLVELWGKVVHPVANNSFPDELALAFIPDLGLSVWSWRKKILLLDTLTSLDLFCFLNWTSGSCQTSCARSASRTNIVKLV